MSTPSLKCRERTRIRKCCRNIGPPRHRRLTADTGISAIPDETVVYCAASSRRPKKEQFEMPDNRYLEFIKRLLSAETYFRSREEVNEREEAKKVEPERRPPEETSK
jgi:hypothetical protein